MTILSRLDAWLGRTLFHPPIILACQLTRQTQYAMHRALWFFAACHATYFAQGESWGFVAILWSWVLVTFIAATVTPDIPTASFGFWRFIWWLIFVLGVSTACITGELTDGTVRALIILFAEYAATIKTIPPRRQRDWRSSAKEART
ncbi:hypothetical protein N6H05_08335 [Sphingobium sp. WTD-1]|uniref:hypothetical protein n=1 Tax=Sphingobium sp. WTD-1 TaxID=2979467 RepID=UPI0024DE4930|nr:hypothetical protein [Sphingobium sp. WTD-1]WIA57789.1 hypothetical protein N6H05_08335 [Sphingobium sp. WTD-1]